MNLCWHRRGSPAHGYEVAPVHHSLLLPPRLMPGCRFSDALLLWRRKSATSNAFFEILLLFLPANVLLMMIIWPRWSFVLMKGVSDRNAIASRLFNFLPRLKSSPGQDFIHADRIKRIYISNNSAYFKKPNCCVCFKSDEIISSIAMTFVCLLGAIL